jgi:hypothetical protein
VNGTESLDEEDLNGGCKEVGETAIKRNLELGEETYQL